jgi:hypothetical protein
VGPSLVAPVEGEQQDEQKPYHVTPSHLSAGGLLGDGDINLRGGREKIVLIAFSTTIGLSSKTPP